MENMLETTESSKYSEYYKQLSHITLFDNPVGISSNFFDSYNQEFDTLFFKYTGNPENIRSDDDSLNILFYESKKYGIAIKKKKLESFTISRLFNEYGNGNIVEVRGGSFSSNQIHHTEESLSQQKNNPVTSNEKKKEPPAVFRASTENFQNNNFLLKNFPSDLVPPLPFSTRTLSFVDSVPILASPPSHDFILNSIFSDYSSKELPQLTKQNLESLLKKKEEIKQNNQNKGSTGQSLKNRLNLNSNPEKIKDYENKDKKRKESQNSSHTTNSYPSRWLSPESEIDLTYKTERKSISWSNSPEIKENHSEEKIKVKKNENKSKKLEVCVK